MELLSRVSIRTRLIGAFAIALVITFAIGLTGMTNSSGLALLIDDMYSNLTPVKDVANANMEAIFMNRGLYDYVIESDKANMDKIKAGIDARYKKYSLLIDKSIQIN